MNKITLTRYPNKLTASKRFSNMSVEEYDRTVCYLDQHKPSKPQDLGFLATDPEQHRYVSDLITHVCNEHAVVKLELTLSSQRDLEILGRIIADAISMDYMKNRHEENISNYR